MSNPKLIPYLLCALSAILIVELYRALTTGRAVPYRGEGAVMRKREPVRFWRCVFSDGALLALCTSLLVQLAI